MLQAGVRVPVTLLTQHPDSGLCLVTLDTEVLDEKKKETAPLALVPACLAQSLEPGSLLQQEVTLYHLASNSSAPPHQEYEATRSIYYKPIQNMQSPHCWYFAVTTFCPLVGRLKTVQTIQWMKVQFVSHQTPQTASVRKT